MKPLGSITSLFKKKKKEEAPEVSNTLWTTKKVKAMLDAIEEGADLSDFPENPFFEGRTEWKAANINMGMTEEEVAEIVASSTNLNHFAENYPFLQTDEGVRLIKLRDYQEKVLEVLTNNRYVVFNASRQIGKATHVNTKVYVKHMNTEVAEVPLINLLYEQKGRSKGIKRIEYLIKKLYEFLERLERMAYQG